MTQIILLPKKEGAYKVKEFRPISLCNVVMKIISKVLANRLKECLTSVISQSQSAFIRNILITDNVILAHEATHTIRGKKRGGSG